MYHSEARKIKYIIGQLIMVEQDEIERAVIKINKNKTICKDSMPLRPLNKQNSGKMKLKGLISKKQKISRGSRRNNKNNNVVEKN